MNIGKNSSNKENCPPNFKKYTISYHHTLLLLFSGQSCPTLCDPMDCSTPGHPAPHHLPEFAQVLVHCISDAIQPSHPLTSSSSALNLSQYQDFPMSFLCSSDAEDTGASASASVLPVNIQGWSPSRLVWTPCCPRDFQEPPSAPQFKGINSLVSCLLSAFTSICDHWEDHRLDYTNFCWQSNVSAFQQTV